MLIRSIHVENFRNLRNVQFEELGNLTILIGPSGSGKSNLVEALYLFFSQFHWKDGPSSDFDEHTWVFRDTTVPIRISLTLKLEDNECRGIFPQKVIRILKKAKKEYKNFSICREVAKPGDAWTTVDLKVGDIPLIEKNELVPIEKLNKSLGVGLKPKAKAFFFDPKASQTNIVGARLIVLGDSAYGMGEPTDSLVREGIVPFKVLPGVDYKAWVQKKNLKLVGRQPTDKELEPFIPKELITPSELQNLLDKFDRLIRERFTLIPAARDVKISLTPRQSFLEQDLQKEIFSLTQEETRISERKSRELLETYRSMFFKTLEPVGQELRVRIGNYRYRIQALGGGEQEILGLLYQLVKTDESTIIALEEPELHLHPALSKKLFSLLRENVAKSNQLFLTTHSPMFVDKLNKKNNWLFWAEEEMAKAEHRPIKEILNTLGGQPE